MSSSPCCCKRQAVSRTCGIKSRQWLLDNALATSDGQALADGPRWPTMLSISASILSRSGTDFGDHFNLNTRTHRQLRHAKGTSGMRANNRAKHLAQQFAGSVGDHVLVRKVSS